MTLILRENEVVATNDDDEDEDEDEKGQQRYAAVNGRKRLLMLEDSIFMAMRSADASSSLLLRVASCT
jgi:hypothetical protein